MIFVSTVAEADAGQSKSQFNTSTLIFSTAAGLIAAVISLLLMRPGNLILFLIGLLIMGLGPFLGYALAAGFQTRAILPMGLGALGFLIGLVPLSSILWPVLVGTTSRDHSLGRLLLWSVVGQIVAAVIVLFIIASSGHGQNPGWLQTGWIVNGLVWSLGVGYALSRPKGTAPSENGS